MLTQLSYANSNYSNHSALLANQKRRSKNLFLSAMTEESFERIKQYLEYVPIKLSKITQQADEPIQYVYFPENAVIFAVNYLENGSSVETGIIGREGLAGISAILSNGELSRETYIRIGGGCLRLNAQIFRAELNRSDCLRHLAMMFVNGYISQIFHKVLCRAYHRLEARTAKWLLMVHDRVDGDQIQVTQDFIAEVLGSPRPGITMTAIKLKQNGLIDYTRGVITILDKKGLEKIACECYQLVNEDYADYHNRCSIL